MWKYTNYFFGFCYGKQYSEILPLYNGVWRKSVNWKKNESIKDDCENSSNFEHVTWMCNENT